MPRFPEIGWDRQGAGGGVQRAIHPKWNRIGIGGTVVGHNIAGVISFSVPSLSPLHSSPVQSSSPFKAIRSHSLTLPPLTNPIMSIPRGSGFQLSDDPSTPLTSATVPFRTLLPPSTHPRIAGISSHTAQSWCESRRRVEAPAWLINRLDKKNIEEYKGFSSDGKPDMSIFKYKEDEGAPVEEACEAVRKLLSGLGDEERKAVCRGSVEDNDEFRLWSNPELYVNPGEC